MISKIFLLLSALFLLSCSTASAENWVQVLKQKDGSQTYYVDSDSVERKDGSATVWVKMVAKSGHYEMVQIRLHKKTLTYDSLHFKSYTRSNKLSEERALKDRNRMIAPGTVVDAAYHFLWPAKEPQWLEIPTPNDSEFKNSIDINSIERNGDTAIAWTKKEDDEGYGLFKDEYDRKSHTYTPLYHKIYHHGKLVDFGNTELYNNTIEPNSEQEAACNIIWPH